MAADDRPGNRYWSVVEPVWGTIDFDGSPAKFLNDFRAVSPVAGHLFAAHWCQSEVCNGGFHQFFYNSTGILAPEAWTGYSAIGLSEWAAILAEAMSFFGNPYPRERSIRVEMLPCGPGRREDWDPFTLLDERFYSWLLAEEDRWERAADRFAETCAS